jgi:hypothetical protein
VADLSHLRSLVDEWVETIGGVALDIVTVRTKEEAPFATGELRDSIESFAGHSGAGLWEGEIGSPSDVAHFTDSGTEAHFIEGNPLLVFHWPEAGGTVFFRSVNHPGSHKHDGWFTEKTPERWADAVAEAASRVSVS